MIDKEFLRYLDIFGTKCSFYTEQKLKLYTPLGGILSITSFVLGFLFFINIAWLNLIKKMPQIVTSSIKEEYHNITFNNEKIWIPWKFSINNNNFNHSGILFPVIKYYYKENKSHEFEYKKLSYKLCNETSMVDKPDNIIIDTPLEQLYCIDMEDLYMGGSFSYNFFYYVEFNLYLCQDGINYDKNNMNCTPYDILNNYLQIIIYYPTFIFQEIDINSPIIIKYNKNSAFLSKNITKIEQIFLKKIILYDQTGLFDRKNKTYNNWGFSSINKDIYYIQEDNNESSSKLYSLEIFIESNTVYYYRTYKTFLFILIECIPIVNLIHNILKLIAKTFKLTSVNRKMTELLFENLSEKPNKFDKYVENIKSKKNNKIAHNYFKKNTEENNIANTTNKNFNNYSTLSLLKKREREIQNNLNIINNNSGSPVLNHKTISENDKNSSFYVRINSLNFKNLLFYKHLGQRYQDPSFPKKKRFVANKLFPFKYYFCTIFTKNLDLTKCRFCLSKKFIKVYSFLCQLFDISAYFILHKEFNIVKNSIFDEQNIKIIEQKSKINVNSQSFMRDMNDCIGSHKFSILGNNNIKNKNLHLKYKQPQSNH